MNAQASRFTAPLVDPLSRTGWTGDDNPKEAATTLATMDFGGASVLYASPIANGTTSCAFGVSSFVAVTEKSLTIRLSGSPESERIYFT